MNIDEIDQFLNKNLPYSISVLEEWENYKRQQSLQVVWGDADYIAVRNARFEWICYVESFVFLDELFEQIYTSMKKRDCRIIVYSKETLKMEDFTVDLSGYHVWLESFMVCKQVKNQSRLPVLATNDDVRELAVMQKDYCLEEINWKYYHNSVDEYVDEYEKKIHAGTIFIEGSPIKAKVELCAVHNHYSKVNSVYTKSEFRRQGFSVKCIEQALTWATMNKVTLCLNVREDNVGAMQVYNKTGFSEESVVLYMRPKN